MTLNTFHFFTRIGLASILIISAFYFLDVQECYSEVQVVIPETLRGEVQIVMNEETIGLYRIVHPKKGEYYDFEGSIITHKSEKCLALAER